MMMTLHFLPKMIKRGFFFFCSSRINYGKKKNMRTELDSWYKKELPKRTRRHKNQKYMDRGGCFQTFERRQEIFSGSCKVIVKLFFPFFLLPHNIFQFFFVYFFMCSRSLPICVKWDTTNTKLPHTPCITFKALLYSDFFIAISFS